MVDNYLLGRTWEVAATNPSPEIGALGVPRTEGLFD
jgi:hypothetical protein